MKINVGMCPRYCQMLREVAKLLQDYSILQNVGISLSEIYRRKEQIANLLQTNSIAACYWQGVDLDDYRLHPADTSMIAFPRLSM